MASNDSRHKSDGNEHDLLEEQVQTPEGIQQVLADAGVAPKEKKKFPSKLGLALFVGALLALLAASGGAYFVLRAPKTPGEPLPGPGTGEQGPAGVTGESEGPQEQGEAAKKN